MLSLWTKHKTIKFKCLNFGLIELGWWLNFIQETKNTIFKPEGQWRRMKQLTQRPILCLKIDEECEYTTCSPQKASLPLPRVTMSHAGADRVVVATERAYGRDRFSSVRPIFRARRGYGRIVFFPCISQW